MSLFCVIWQVFMGSLKPVGKAGWLTWWGYREKRLSSKLTADGEETLLHISHTQPGQYEEDTEPRDETLNWTETLLTSTGSFGTCGKELMSCPLICLQEEFFFFPINVFDKFYLNSRIFHSGFLNNLLKSVAFRQKDDQTWKSAFCCALHDFFMEW